ncbi:MAG: phosphodiesterase [Mycobacterium sp.]|nr:phosphodiesterase [Mycobacterium sp.]
MSLLSALPVLPAAPAPASAQRTASPAAAVTASAVGGGPTKVLLIGTDGTNLSKILEYAYDSPASGFRIAMEDGITGATSLIGHTTISGPSWSTILTGAWDNKTGVINNLFNPAPYLKWPTAINLIEYNKPAVKTAVVADWQYIIDMAGAGGYPADVREFVEFTNTWEDTDDVVADKTIALIQAAKATDPTFIFSYQVAVDEEGHLHGGGSTQYRDAVINTSENIAKILGAVSTWETANPSEQWTVIITTDHGHQQSKGFGHGFQSPNETSSFVIFDLEGDGANDGKQNLGYTNADITPTIVNLFGIAQRSDFDGVPLQSKTTGIVSPVNLKQALSDAIATNGYPNIGTDIALGTRTIFASVPYLIDGFVTNITDLLQSVIDRDIFLISGIAQLTKWIVEFNGDLAVGVTQALARVVATLTGSGTIPPSDSPLPAPPANSELPWVLEATAVLA